MKFPSIVVLSLLVSLSARADDYIDKLLDERIEENKKLGREFAADAKDSEFAEALVPLEKKNGEDWVALLEHIKAKKDLKLSYLMLLTELQSELSNAYYELEYPDGPLGRIAAKAKVKRYEEKLQKLEAAYKAASGGDGDKAADPE